MHACPVFLLLKSQAIFGSDIEKVNTFCAAGITLHDTGLLGVAATGEKDSSDGLDLAKGTVR
jgi:hypothetical protein